MKNGIDVSYCQTKVDWNKVKAAGIDFALIRVGYCYNNGALKIDNMFKSHMAGATAAGIDVGVYLYSYATSTTAAKKAAQEVVKAIKQYTLTYPVCFDIEYESIYTGGSKRVNTDICKAFLDEIEDAGYYAMLYCSKDFLDSYLYPAELTAYDKWIAQYASKCTCPHPYGIWQYTGTGRVSGVASNVDRNYAYKDYPTIIKGMDKTQLQKQQLPYSVIISGSDLNSLKGQISKKGYFTFMSNGKLCVGKFATVAEANKTAADLKRKGFTGAVGKW